MANPIRALLNSYVRSITFESNVNEPWTIREPFKEGGPGAVDSVSSTLKPKVTIELWDQAPVVIAPAGEPSREIRSGIQTGAVIGGIGLAGLILFALSRKMKG